MNLVFLATSWSATKGGINALNHDLCTALAIKGLDVTCIVPAKDLCEEQEAEASGVNLVSLNLNDEFDKNAIHIIAESHSYLCSTETIWVGHDIKTGKLSLECKEKFGGTSIVFHHMDYANYYSTLNPSKSREKIESQRSIFGKADIVVGIGPRLAANAKRFRKGHDETYELVPGFPSISRTPHAFDFRITIAGRLDSESDPIKKSALATICSANILSEQQSGRGSITLIGTTPESLEIIKEKTSINPNVAINAFTHISDRSSYFSHIASSDLIVMPSLKEGFGLVAWETIGLEIPVIISESSGVYELLRNKNLLHLSTTVKITGNDENDRATLTDAIRDVFKNYQNKSDQARELHTTLSTYTWERCAADFIGFLPPTENSDATEHESDDIQAKTLEKTKNRTDLLTKSIPIGKDYSFPRFEDLLKINHKNRDAREAIISTAEGTDFSKGQKIKFEFWKTSSPAINYFLVLFPSITIAQTVTRAVEILSKKKIFAREITILRRDKGDGQIYKIFQENNYNSKIKEYTFKEYVWQYCVDEHIKTTNPIKEISNYIDQTLVTYEESKPILNNSARNFFKEKLLEKNSPVAHVIIAPGGMGKTSLCLSIASGIIANQPSQSSPILIQSENLRAHFLEVGFSHIKIESLYDLYEVYSKSEYGSSTLDKLTFELSVLCGNIVLIIDGLDELASLLQEKFDLLSFLASIKTLHNQLGTSQVVLTTRDSKLITQTQLSELGMARYELLGFNEDDWATYARRRFRHLPYFEAISEKLFKLLSALNLQEEGRIIPFFVDVVSNVLESDFSNPTNGSFEMNWKSTPYHSNNDLLDHIIYSVVRRELRRHKIDISAQEVIELLSELICVYGGAIPLTALKEDLEALYDSRHLVLFEKIILNPLFKANSAALTLRYSFLADYFRSLYIIKSIIIHSQTKEFVKSLARASSSASTEIVAVKKYFSDKHEQLHNSLKVILLHYKDEIGRLSKSDVESKMVESLRKASSTLLSLYASVRNFSGVKLREQLLELLANNKSSASPNTLDGLYIYGEFPSLDFSDLTIKNSKFTGYKKITSSRFTSAKFIYCTFENCASNQDFNESVLSAIFDTCNMGDLAMLIDKAESRGAVSEAALEEDIQMFLSSFFKNSSPYDPKLNWIKFSNKTAKLKRESFSKLCPEYFTVKVKKSDETYYTLAPTFIDSARKFFSDNYADRKMQEFIDFIKN
ncbi:NACHT domain-containing protein [Pseudomonas sp. H2_H09]